MIVTSTEAISTQAIRPEVVPINVETGGPRISTASPPFDADAVVNGERSGGETTLQRVRDPQTRYGFGVGAKGIKRMAVSRATSSADRNGPSNGP